MNGTPELNAALAMAQGEFPAITKEKTARTGAYSYSYAPLETVLDACRPVLSKHGLAIIQLLESNETGPAIRTELRHKDGGVIGSSFPLPTLPQKPQELGSLLTYLRRYAIVALLGVAAEDDDDGEQAQQAAPAKPTKKAKEPKPEPIPPSKEQLDAFYKPTAREPVVDQITASQNRLMHGLFTSKGIKERQDRLDYVMRVLGRPISSSTELTKTDAKKVIDHLEKYDPDIEATWPMPMTGY